MFCKNEEEENDAVYIGEAENIYGFIEQFIDELGKKFHIKEIVFDRWGAVQMVQNLEGMGFTVVPFGQAYKDMSPPTKELMKQRVFRKSHMVNASYEAR